MADKNNDFNAIRIGTRIRHTADGAVGRIVWANASTVKVQWDDGEKINWKRGELAEKGLEVLEAEVNPEPVAEPASETTTTETAQTAEPATVEQTLPAGILPEASPSDSPATEPARKPRPRAAKSASGEKKLSAIDAAARVLAEEHRPMGCQELIGAMAAKGYWTSPGGKTPVATLYSSILREIDTKGDQARFQKVGRGMFARRPQA